MCVDLSSSVCIWNSVSMLVTVQVIGNSGVRVFPLEISNDRVPALADDSQNETSVGTKTCRHIRDLRVGALLRWGCFTPWLSQQGVCIA